MNATNTKNLIIGTFVLIFAITFFGGFAKDFLGGIFDFSKLAGHFPQWLKTHGSDGAKGGFIFALTLIPVVMLALGFVAIFERYHALYAASKLLNFILRPILGIPGACSISLIASIQSTDAGASTTKFLYQDKQITYKELLIFSAFQFSAGAMLVNFLSSFSPLLLVKDSNGLTAPTTIITCLAVIFVFKIIGANIMRLYIRKFVKESETI